MLYGGAQGARYDITQVPSGISLLETWTLTAVLHQLLTFLSFFYPSDQLPTLALCAPLFDTFLTRTNQCAARDSSRSFA